MVTELVNEAREKQAANIRSQKRPQLIALLDQYQDRVKEPDYSRCDPDEYMFADMRRYPEMTDEEEMAAARILELSNGKLTTDSEQAKECLIGSHLPMVWKISRKFAWINSASSRLTREDLYQSGARGFNQIFSNLALGPSSVHDLYLQSRRKRHASRNNWR